MIKRTLYFENPAYLSVKNKQLVIKLPEVENNNTLSDDFRKKSIKTIPIEDIGVIILDNKQITLTHGLIECLVGNNTSVITCDSDRMPNAMILPLFGNTIQNERFRHQINATEPLKKGLWQQTAKIKVRNQSSLLKKVRKCNTDNMDYWCSQVKSGDPDNYEARAAAYYWKSAFPQIDNFVRDRNGAPPNQLLNYGYAILRAVIARSLVGSGLLPTLGIHHHNRYNAYCLADDIMEPYRPFVDEMVFSLVDSDLDYSQLTSEIKYKLLTIPTIDVIIEEKRSPLMIAATITSASLQKCFEGRLRKIKYPQFE